MAVKSQFNLKGVVAIAVGILLLIILFPFLKLIKKFVSKGTTAVDDIVQQAEMNVLKKKYGNHRDFDLIANDVVPSIYHAFHDDWD
ncbi:MAG TPA: hypothetical protein VGD89_14505, partial [Flavipsychrobacter sp.]